MIKVETYYNLLLKFKEQGFIPSPESLRGIADLSKEERLELDTKAHSLDLEIFLRHPTKEYWISEIPLKRGDIVKSKSTFNIGLVVDYRWDDRLEYDIHWQNGNKSLRVFGHNIMEGIDFIEQRFNSFCNTKEEAYAWLIDRIDNKDLSPIYIGLSPTTDSIKGLNKAAYDKGYVLDPFECKPDHLLCFHKMP